MEILNPKQIQMTKNRDPKQGLARSWAKRFPVQRAVIRKKRGVRCPLPENWPNT